MFLVNRQNYINKNKLLIFLFCCAYILGTQPSGYAHNIQTINIVTPEWVGTTNKDGSGFFFELTRLIYQPEDIQLNIKFVPFPRATQSIKSHNQDAMFALSKAKKNDFYLSSEQPIFVEITSVLFKKSSKLTWHKVDSLTTGRFVWIRGYEYERLFPEIKNYHEVPTSLSGFKMLDSARADFFIDAYTSTVDFFKKHPQIEANYTNEIIHTNNLHMAFSNTAKGKQLQQIFDKNMKKLVKSGALNKLANKWQISLPTTHHSK